MRPVAPLFLALITTVASAHAADRCTPSPELAAFIRSLPTDLRLKREALEARLAQTPDDVALHRLFVDSYVYQRKAERDRYQRLLESHPGNLDYQYLQARSLVGSNTREALRLYAALLEKDPNYPWVHISQLDIYRSEAFRDRTKLAASIAAVQRVCPSSFAPYSVANEIADDDAAADAAVKLRALLKEATTPAELRLYSNLWALEFRVRPSGEHDAERKQVAEDLKRIIPFTAAADDRLRGVIENGAKLAGDTELARRRAAQRKPEPIGSLVTATNTWLKAHPRPKWNAPAEERHAYGAALLKEVAEWEKIAPGQASHPIERARALAYVEAPPEEIARAGDEAMANLRREPGTQASWIVNLARLYLEAGVLLDRVPPLCQEAIERFDDPEAVIEIDLAPSPHNAANRQRMVVDHLEALIVLAQWHEKRGEKDKAHATLWQAADYLASKAPAAGEKNQEILNWQNTGRRRLLWTRAEMAEREGRKLDALIGYRETVAVDGIGRNDLTARQRRLWKELGGTDEGWQQWSTPAAPTALSAPAGSYKEQSAEGRKLPPLMARDTLGGQWTLDRFAGKTVIAVVWATWCEPCRAELPYFAKLAERLKGRDDVLAVSFNTDDNIAVAETFAKSNGYRFPVLSVKQYAEDLMPISAIPRTWIMKGGLIAKEHIGFGGDGDKWVERLLAELP